MHLPKFQPPLSFTPPWNLPVCLMCPPLMTDFALYLTKTSMVFVG